VEPDISILRKSGHFYFALTEPEKLIELVISVRQTSS